MTNSGILTDTKEESLVQSAIDQILTTRTFDVLKANIEGFDSPSPLAKASGEGAFVPDIIGIKNGRKFYFELALKNNQVTETISKWKLLSQLADLRDGKFYLLVPKGHLAFVRRLMTEYSVRATIINI